jgi:divalent metal cation (Fe/Co/Zn/Cd) transporter
VSATPTSRATDLRLGVAIEVVTIGWMVIEATIALGAGVASHSVSLETFGLDSLIELVSAGTLLWRLEVERHEREALGRVVSEGRIEQVERRASRIVGWALFALVGYIVLAVAVNALIGQRAEIAPVGVALAAASSLIMPALWWSKRFIAARIDSAALRADAACSLVCAYMSLTLLAGLALNALFGWWWADSVAALALIYFIVREGREALEAAEGQDTCACGD